MLKNVRTGLLVIAITLAMGSVQASQAAEPKSAEEAVAIAQMQALQNQVGPGKRAFVELQLQLTAEQAGKFWPVYDAHQAALAKLNQRRIENILAYAKVWNADAMDDAKANTLATEALAIEKEEAAQLERTYKHAKKAIPAKQAVRYLQLESKLRAIIRFEQAAQVPFVQ